MDRPLRNGLPRSQDHPVLVFEGARGTGKTAMLDRWTGLLDQVVPFARIDFDANLDVSQPKLLTALAFELSRRCADLLTLRFPRFTTGRLVMRMSLDLENHFKACRQVEEGLDQERSPGAVEQILIQAAPGVLGFVQQHYAPGVPLQEAAGPVVRGAISRLATIVARKSNRITLGAFLDWYGHGGRGFTNDATAVLVDLNRWACDADDEDNSQRINELLWDAFLTDLGDEYRRAGRARDLSANSVILLDNVDTEGGRSFLSQLVRSRKARLAGYRLEPEPLTVIATSRGALLSDLPLAEQIEYSGDCDHAAHLVRSDGTVRHWWCRYPLADLTVDQVGSMVSELNLPDGNNERLTRMTHQLTGGHPSSTRLVLDAVAERPQHRDELARLLDLPERCSSCRTWSTTRPCRRPAVISASPTRTTATRAASRCRCCRYRRPDRHRSPHARRTSPATRTARRSSRGVSSNHGGRNYPVRVLDAPLGTVARSRRDRGTWQRGTRLTDCRRERCSAGRRSRHHPVRRPGPRWPGRSSRRWCCPRWSSPWPADRPAWPPRSPCCP